MPVRIINSGELRQQQYLVKFLYFSSSLVFIEKIIFFSIAPTFPGSCPGWQNKVCLLYRSDAADEEDSVDLGI